MATSKLISASQCDKAYKLRHGTSANAARAGVVRFVERAGRGRYRRTIFIDAHHAELVWGAKQGIAQGIAP